MKRSNSTARLQTRLANGSITVRDFMRELAKSERFYEMVVSVNNNYRLVDICLRRLQAVLLAKMKKLVN